MNISNFMTWFLNQFIYIGTNALAYLENIKLIGTISLLDFIITIIIIQVFIGIVLTIPQIATKNTREKRK